MEKILTILTGRVKEEIISRWPNIENYNESQLSMITAEFMDCNGVIVHGFATLDGKVVIKTEEMHGDEIINVCFKKEDNKTNYYLALKVANLILNDKIKEHENNK